MEHGKVQKEERRYREQKRGMGKTLKGKVLFSETFFLPPRKCFLTALCRELPALLCMAFPLDIHFLSSKFSS